MCNLFRTSAADKKCSKTRNVAHNRVLRTRSTFSKSLVVSVALLKMGSSGLIFVDPCYSRRKGEMVNWQYYHDVLLSQQMLHVTVIKLLSIPQPRLVDYKIVGVM